MQEQNNNKLHDTAALRALTQEEIVSDPAGQDQNHVHEDVEINLDSHDDAGVSLSQRSATRRATQARFAGKQTREIGLQFRKIAIPALLGVGVILWVIGGLAVWMKNNTPPEVAGKNPLLANAELFMWICIIMGLTLVGGAIFFLIELKNSRR